VPIKARSPVARSGAAPHHQRSTIARDAAGRAGAAGPIPAALRRPRRLRIRERDRTASRPTELVARSGAWPRLEIASARSRIAGRRPDGGCAIRCRPTSWAPCGRPPLLFDAGDAVRRLRPPRGADLLTQLRWLRWRARARERLAVVGAERRPGGGCLARCSSGNDRRSWIEAWPRLARQRGERRALSLLEGACGGSGSGHRAGEPRRVARHRVRSGSSYCRLLFHPRLMSPWLELARS